MKIAFIGPGYVSIPPKDYGAIEILIWDLTQALRKLGHHVDIYNDLNLENIALTIESQSYDFVHLQYDDHVQFFAPRWKNKTKWGFTNHYGWFNDRSKWSASHHYWFKLSSMVPNIICLSEQIANIYNTVKQKNQKIFILRNGTNTDNFKFYENSNMKAICVGCIDQRKNQFLLNNLCSNIDFVGPIRQDGIFEFKNNNSYLGVWNKQQLYDNLGNYACLILASRGEAAPLVVPEAMAAGLSLVVSKESSANLEKKDWILQIDINDVNYMNTHLNDDINNMIKNNIKYRKDIRNYAINKFNWDIIAEDYLKIIKNSI